MCRIFEKKAKPYSDAFPQKKHIQDFFEKKVRPCERKKDGPYKHPPPEPEKKRDLIDPHLLDLIDTHLLDLITTPPVLRVLDIS